MNEEMKEFVDRLFNLMIDSAPEGYAKTWGKLIKIQGDIHRKVDKIYNFFSLELEEQQTKRQETKIDYVYKCFEELDKGLDKLLKEVEE